MDSYDDKLWLKIIVFEIVLLIAIYAGISYQVERYFFYHTVSGIGVPTDWDGWIIDKNYYDLKN